MFRSLSMILMTVALASLFAPISVHAAHFSYNESVSGDLVGTTSSSPQVTFGPLGAGDTLAVTGTLNASNGRGPDESDVFRFTATTQTIIGLSALSLGTASDLVFFLYREPGDSIIGARFASIATDRQNLFGILDPGSYALELVPANNSGTLGYTVNVTSVPEPSALALCGIAGLFGLGAVPIRRRRVAS